jgi:alpha-glucosidase (family GH31 glycosyl hydrolase)
VTEDGSIVNDLTVGEYDIVVTTQPERDTFEDSQFEHAVQLRELGVQIPDKYLIKSSRLRDKGEIVQALEAESTSPEAQEQKQLALEAQRGEVRKVHAEATQKEADAAKKTNEAGIANDQNAEFVAKMKELEQEFALKQAQLQQEMELERQRFQQEMALEREKAAAKMQLEREMAEQKKALVDAQVVATHAQAAATIKTADAKAEAMKKAPASAAASGSGSPADSGAKSKGE